MWTPVSWAFLRNPFPGTSLYRAVPAGCATAPPALVSTAAAPGGGNGGGGGRNAAASERSATTPSSAMSSREGTPLPMKPGDEMAPNVDISKVEIKVNK